MKTPWGAVSEGITSITGLISEFIEDPDLKLKLMQETQKLEHETRLALLSTKTSPRVDAAVKILLAIRDIVIPMLRPLGGACMTAFGMYAHYRGIEIDAAMHAVFDGAFPAWGVSRHVNKQRGVDDGSAQHQQKNKGRSNQNKDPDAHTDTGRVEYDWE